MSKQLLKTWYPFFLGILLLAVHPAQSQTDPSLLFAKGIGNEYFGGGNLAIQNIKIDASGNRYVTGSFNSTADFDPGAGTANLTSAGSPDIFLAKYNALGNYVWAKSMGGTGADAGYSLALDGSGNVVVTGSFYGTADFDPGSGTANLTSASGLDIFLAKYDASGNYVWAKGIGGTSTDIGYSLALDDSGNVVVTGYFTGTNIDFDPSTATANLTNAGGTDIFLAKYDASGNYVWAKSMGGTNSADAGYSLAFDGSGNVVVTGSFSVTADFDPSTATANLTSAGGTDIFLAKYDASGNYVWAKRMGGTGADVGNSLALDGSGNVVVTGSFNGTADFDPSAGTANLTSAGNTDMFLAKYDASGIYVWAKGMGGTLADAGNSLALDGSGNVVVTGYFNGTADFDASAGTPNLTSAGGNDIFLAKYDASGNYLWAEGMGGTTADIGYSLALDGSGNVLVTGYFTGTVDFDPGAGTANLVAGPNNGFISSYTSANGTYNSALLLGRYLLAGNFTSTAIVKDGSGNLYVTGSFNGTADFDPGAGTANLTSAGGTDIFLAKYDASGNYVWAKAMGGTAADAGYSLAFDGSGNVVVTGSFSVTADFDPSTATANLTSAGGTDIFLAKYDASGNYVWAKAMGGTAADAGSSLALDGSGNVVVTGIFSVTADFDPSAGTANLTSAGGFDIFLAKYDASGNYAWAKRMGGSNSEYGNSLALDGSGNVVVTGYFTGTVDFDPGAGTANLTSAGAQDIFLAKYDALGNYLWAKGMGGTSTDFGYSLALDGSGNVVVTGLFIGTADFDPSAGTANLTSAGGNDIFLAKYDASGNYVWAKGMGGTSTDMGNSLALDGSGNLYVTGSFNTTADFDPGSGTANLTSAGGTDIFLAKYDAFGNYVWAKAMGGTTADVGNSLALDGSGNVVVTGYFNGTADFDPSAGTTNLTSMSGGQYGFIAAYGSCINPTTGGTIASAQSGTNPFNPEAFTSSVAASGGTGTLEYKWQSSTTSNSAGFADIASSNAATYTPGVLTVTNWFKRLARVGCKSDWTGAAESNVLEVTVNSACTPTSSIETISACDAYVWHGITYTASNSTATWTGVNAGGCDSVVTLNLTIYIGWIGGSGNWSNSSNWCGGSPSNSANIVISSGNPKLDANFTVSGSITISGSGSLTINPGKTLTISGTVDFGGKPVTVKSDATGTGSIGQITGILSNASNVTMERYIPNNGFRSWRLLSVPTYGTQTINAAWQEGNTPMGNNTPGYGTQVTGTTTALGFDDVSIYPGMLSFNGTNFVGIPRTSIPISTNKAYFLYMRGDRTVGVSSSTTTNTATTLRTNGNLYQGTQTSDLIPANSYGLIGNPFASAINFNALTRTGGVKNAYYLWDSKIQSGNTLGTYQAFSATNGFNCLISGGSFALATPNTTIQSGQAFFVETNGTAGSISIPDSSKVASSGSTGYKLSGDLVKIDSRLYSISSTGTSMADANVVVFDSAYSNAVDGDDASKFSNTGENLAILRNAESLVIEGRNPVNAADTIFFKMWNMKPQAYQLEFVPQNLGTQNLTARLEDSYLNTSTAVDLSTNTLVDFTVNATPASFASNRFRIVFAPSLVLPVNFQSISASRKASNALVNWKVSNEINIRSYEVERSTNGSKYDVVGTVTGNAASAYSFTDLNVPSSNLFYRVKSIGAAGDVKFSTVVKLGAESTKPSYAVVPNPVEGAVMNIQFGNQPKGMYQLRLVNAVGQQVTSIAVTHPGGFSTHSVNLPSMMAKGTYQLEIIAPDKTISVQKVMVISVY